MKRIKLSTTLILGIIVAFTSIATSCKKAEKGDTGPQGSPGVNGTNGNANVKTMTVTVTAVNWTLSSTGGIQTTVITNTNITQDIVDHGAVMVYLIDGTQNSALPLTMYPTSGYSINMQHVSALNTVTISVQRNDLVAAANPGSLTFKVVTLAASARLSNPNLDLNNFEAVKQAFKLEE